MVVFISLYMLYCIKHNSFDILWIIRLPYFIPFVPHNKFTNYPADVLGRTTKSCNNRISGLRNFKLEMKFLIFSNLKPNNKCHIRPDLKTKKGTDIKSIPYYTVSPKSFKPRYIVIKNEPRLLGNTVCFGNAQLCHTFICHCGSRAALNLQRRGRPYV